MKPLALLITMLALYALPATIDKWTRSAAEAIQQSAWVRSVADEHVEMLESVRYAELPITADCR